VEINPHLNETELAEFVLNSTQLVGSHLEYCDACLNEVTRLRDLVRGLRGSGEQDEGFWAAQGAAIRSRIVSQDTRPPARAGRLAWAMATATIAIATVLVLGGHAPRGGQTAPQAKVDPDHELLIEVERTLQTGGPEALEPAALLAREIGGQATANGTSPQQPGDHP
jgi:hypothetical protein